MERSPLEGMAIRVGVIGDGNVLAHEIFPPGSTVSVGSNDSCSVQIPEEYGVGKRTFVKPGPRLKLFDKMHLQANVLVGGRESGTLAHELAIRGRVGDVRRAQSDLGEDPILLSPKVVIRFDRLSVLLEFDEA